MKLFYTILLVACTSSVAFAQSINKRDVPADVLKSYLSQNSKGALDSSWSKQTITVYKVNYMDDGMKYEAQYFEDGSWIKTITSIPVAELTPAITNQINTMYSGRKVNNAAIELNPEGRFYTVEIGQGAEKMTLYFLSSGKFVK
jgi:hypothetical protein